MAAESGNGSSSKRGSAAGVAKTHAFALLPLGKHLGKSAIALTRPVIIVGSRESCRIHLNSSSVSQQHALLVHSGGTYYIHDLASRAHVIVGDQQIKTRDLVDNDELKIGSFTLRFTGPAGTPADRAPAALLQSGADGKSIAMTQRVLLIGRRPGSDIVLADAAVSTSHAVVFEMNSQWVVRDLGSRTGTWVNGVQVHQHVLAAGDRIKIGPYKYDFQLAASPVSELDSLIDEAILSDREAEKVADNDLGLDFESEAEPTTRGADDVSAIAPDLGSEQETAANDTSAGEVAASNTRRGWRASAPEPIGLSALPDTAETTPLPVEPATPPTDLGLEFADADVAESAPFAATFNVADAGLSAGPGTGESIDVSEKYGLDPAETDGVDSAALDLEPLKDSSASAAPFDLSSLSFESHSDETADLPLLHFADADAGVDHAAEAHTAEAERLESERVAAEKAEREHVEAEKAAADLAERNRLEAERERVDAERAAAELAERERLEAERLAAEEIERRRIDAERAAAELAERERLEAERLAAEETERQRVDAERAAAELAERERLEAERLAAEETERLAAEETERRRIDAERAAAELAERERLEAERLAAELAQQERLEAERLAAKETERQRVDAERAAAELAERERLEAERLAAEEADRIAIESAAARANERLTAERLENERADLSASDTDESFGEASDNSADDAVNKTGVDAPRRSLVGDAAETIASTDPSPESALEFKLDSLAFAADRETDSEHVGEPVIDFDPKSITLSDDPVGDPVDAISDSAFGRAVEAFSGDLSGSLVEPAGEIDALSEIAEAVGPIAGDDTLEDVASTVLSADESLDPLPLFGIADSESLEPTTPPSSSLLERDAADALSASIEAAPDDAFVSPDLLSDSVSDENSWSSDGDLELLSVDPGRMTGEPESTDASGNPFDLAGSMASSEDFAPPSEPVSSDATIAESSIESSTAETLEQISTIGDIAIEPAVDMPADARADVAVPRRMPTAEERGQFWGTEATVLGGMPLVLPEERAISLFANAAPVEPFDGLTEEVLDEDEQIDSVSALLGSLLDEPTDSPSQSPSPSPSQSQSQSATIQPPTEPAADAFTHSDAVGSKGPSTGGKAGRRPLSGLSPGKAGTGKLNSTPRLDEQIPPFGSTGDEAGIARNGNRGSSGRRSDLAAAMDSLSQPPVHETDVFSHGSMPSEDLAAPDSNTPDLGMSDLVEDPFSPRGQSRALPVTPMDLLGDVQLPVNGRRLRSPLRGPGIPAVARIDLPNVPFWSGKPPETTAKNGNGRDNGRANGKGPTDDIGHGPRNGAEKKVPPPVEPGNGSGPTGTVGSGEYSNRQPHSADEEIGVAGDTSLAPVAGRLESGTKLRARNGAALTPRGARHGGAKPLVTYAADVDPNAVHQVRRRRFVRVTALLLGGTVLAVGAFYGCLKFVPVHSQVEARVRFLHLADARESDQRTFRASQAETLLNERIRIAARRNLAPEISGGILADPAAYSQLAGSASWPTPRQDVLSIRFQSTDPEADSQRVKAVAQALYDSNGILIDDANRNRDQLANASEQQSSLLRQIADVQKAIEQNRALADAWPSVEKMSALTANADRLNKAWKDAEVALKNAQADVERLRAAAPQSARGASAVNTAQPPAADLNLGQMQTELGAIQQKLAAAKLAHDRQATQARSDLDAALGQFQQQVAAARELSKDNPQLQSYVASAQRLQETTHKLVDDLISRQEQNYSRLTNLQATLGQKMQQRRQEMWQSDEKLKNLNDQLEYTKRQYNTAIGTGDQKSAAELKAQIDLLENMVKARQDLLPDDPFYSDAVDALQKIVDQTQQTMKEDRQHSDEALDALQKSFASNQPAIEKLPAEQKNLAADMEKRLADINAARAKFNDVASDAGSDDATKKLQDQVSQLAVSIDSRKKQLADQSLTAAAGQSEAKRKADLDARESELPKLAQVVTDSKNAYWAADAELQSAKHAVDEAKAATDKGTELTDQKIRLNAQLDQARASVELAQEAVRTSIEPVQIADSDIQRQLGADNRALYGSISSASILLIAGVLILMTIHAANQELPLNALEPTEDLVDPFWQASPAAAANGHAIAESPEPFPGASDSIAVLDDADEIALEDSTVADQEAALP